MVIASYNFGVETDVGYDTHAYMGLGRTRTLYIRL